MQLIPAFEIGLLNAWIFWLYFMLPMVVFSIPSMKKRAPATPDMSVLEKRAIRINIISKTIMFFPILYSIFLPFTLGTLWFYIGLPIALIGTVLYIIVWVNLANRPAWRQTSYQRAVPLFQAPHVHIRFYNVYRIGNSLCLLALSTAVYHIHDPYHTICTS